MSEQDPHTPSRLRGQYRNTGFDVQIGQWREHVIGEIQSKEVVFNALQKQIEAGMVLPDEYYQTLTDYLQDLRQDLGFIQDEEHKW